MKGRKVVVVGSTNMDMVVQTERIPVPGETILSGSFFMNPGGKGANQAVAVARLGGEVVFITRLGNDMFGKRFQQLFVAEGMDARFINLDDKRPTGVAMITVDRHAENCIVVASGANAAMQPVEVQEALQQVHGAGILLLQLEVPIEVVEFAISYAWSKNIKVILNPAPARALSPALLQRVDILTPNQTEAGMLSGIAINNLQTAAEAAIVIHEKGVRNIVITMGPQGALVCEEGRLFTIATKKVKALDTTAAGDVFNGALAVALSEGKSLVRAVEFACDAAAISVTRLGAQSSIPYRDEVPLLPA